MPKNAQVLDQKPENTLVFNAKPENILVFDPKPKDNVFGEVSFTALALGEGMSMGPGWYMYVTYPDSTLNRI